MKYVLSLMLLLVVRIGNADSINYANCLLPSPTGTCTSTLSWTSASQSACVYKVTVATGQESLFACTGASGIASWPYTTAWPGHIFRVKVGATATANVRVFGRQTQRSGFSGGGNYHYASLGPNEEWVPYAYLARWPSFIWKETIQNHIQLMHDNGQRSLRLMVWYFHQANIGGSQNGYACGSRQRTDSNGTYYLDRQCQSSLAGVIAWAKQVGFQFVEIAAASQWRNNPWDCEKSTMAGSQVPVVGPDRGYGVTSVDDFVGGSDPTWAELAEENYQVLKELRAIGEASGITYLLDLGNEEIPQTGRPSCHLAYVQDTWNRFANEFGTTKTVGFSIAMDQTWAVDNRLNYVTTVYGSRPPAALDLHIYGNNGTEQQILTASIAKLQTMPESYRVTPIIVGESYYNDGTSALGMKNALQPTSTKLITLMQWPLQRGQGLVPADDIQYFNTYQSNGF